MKHIIFLFSGILYLTLSLFLFKKFLLFFERNSKYGLPKAKIFLAGNPSLIACFFAIRSFTIKYSGNINLLFFLNLFRYQYQCSMKEIVLIFFDLAKLIKSFSSFIPFRTVEVPVIIKFIFLSFFI